MITAFREPEIVEDSVNSGEVFRFLHKPVQIESVEEVVNTGVQRYEQILNTKRENAKKDKTIHDLIKQLNRKPLFEKAFILSLFIALGYFTFSSFSKFSYPTQNAKPLKLEFSSGPKIITLDECLQSAQAELSACSEELNKLGAENKLKENGKLRRQASCEALHLQKKAICQARYSD